MWQDSLLLTDWIGASRCAILIFYGVYFAVLASKGAVLVAYRENIKDYPCKNRKIGRQPNFEKFKLKEFID